MLSSLSTHLYVNNRQAVPHDIEHRGRQIFSYCHQLGLANLEIHPPSDFCLCVAASQIRREQQLKGNTERKRKDKYTDIRNEKQKHIENMNMQV